MSLIWKCSDNHLEPVFKADIVELLTSSAYEWHLMYGYRTLAEQAVLYEAHLKGGALAAPPGHSAHNFGLAVDVQLITNGKADWNVFHEGWQWLFQSVKAAPRLHSGRSFGDSDHIEKVNWHQFEHWANTTPPDPIT